MSTRHDNANKKLSKREKHLLKYLVSYPSTDMPTRQQMSERLNISINRVQELLKNLQDKGYLKLIKHKPRGIELTQEAEDYVF